LSCRHLAEAFRATASENGVVVDDGESTLLLRHVPGDQRHRYVNIDKQTAYGAVDMIMTIGSGIVSAGLVGKTKFQHFTVPRQQVQGPVDRAICNTGIPLSHAFEYLTSRQVRIRFLNDREDHRPLGCLSIPFVRRHLRSALADRPSSRTS
jgi:hypothetical protein